MGEHDADEGVDFGGDFGADGGAGEDAWACGGGDARQFVLSLGVKLILGWVMDFGVYLP